MKPYTYTKLSETPEACNFQIDYFLVHREDEFDSINQCGTWLCRCDDIEDARELVEMLNSWTQLDKDKERLDWCETSQGIDWQLKNVGLVRRDTIDVAMKNK